MCTMVHTIMKYLASITAWVLENLNNDIGHKSQLCGRGKIHIHEKPFIVSNENLDDVSLTEFLVSFM